MERLDDRSDAILKAIITEYVASGEPVGSRTISRRKDVALSAASIRNIMSDLTEWGFITQPHVSAGRVPTDTGLRIYVNEILKSGPMPSEDQSTIESLIVAGDLDVIEVMRRSSSVLAGLSRQTGVAATPAAVEQTFKTIDFIKVAEDKILVILVSNTGFTLNKMIYDEDGVDQDSLERYSRMLNDMLKDLDLRQARTRIEQELAKEKTMVDAMLAKVLKLGYVLLSQKSAAEIFIEGRTNILDEPEFAQIEKLKAVLVTFEEKEKLLKLLEKTLEAEGLQIFVGSEIGMEEMSTCSIIAYPLRTREASLGSVAVIGPRRMDYQKMVDLVYTTGGVITRILKKAVERNI